MSGKLSTVRLGVLTLAVAQLFAGSVMAQQQPCEHLIPGRGTSVFGENSLLGASHTGYLAAIYLHVDMRAPWALVVHEGDNGRTFLELREVSGSDSLLFGGTIKTVSKEIPRDLATAIAKAIDRMIGEAVQPESIPVPKREGSTTEFLSFGMDNAGRSAWIRSAPPHTKPGRLLELSGALWSMSQVTGDALTSLQEKAADIALELAGP
jgi:hypothetical protein